MNNEKFIPNNIQNEINKIDEITQILKQVFDLQQLPHLQATNLGNITTPYSQDILAIKQTTEQINKKLENLTNCSQKF